MVILSRKSKFGYLNILGLLFVSSCDVKVRVASFLESGQNQEPEKAWVSFVTATATVSESSTHQIEVQVTDQNHNLKLSAQDIKLSFSFGGAALQDVDYQVQGNEIILPAGSSSVTLVIEVMDNSVAEEPDKNLIIELAHAEGVELGSILQHSVVIRDDELVVKPTFPINGQNWTDNIMALNPLTRYSRITSDLFPADIPSNGGDFINGGELRRVEVRNHSSCQELEMIDSEQAFLWRCFEWDSRVFFNSMGFNKGKGLSNLILPDGSNWKNLSVQLRKEAQVIKESDPAQWWTNPIIVLDSSNINGGVSDPRLELSNPNTVYAITENITSRGINFNADGISLVTLPGVTLTSRATLASNDCRPFWPSGIQNCFIWVKDKQRVWIEGSISSLSPDTIFVSDQVDFLGEPREVRIHNCQITGNSNIIGVLFNSGSRLFMSDILMSHLGIGIFVDNARKPIYHDVYIHNTHSTGLDTGWLSTWSRALNIHINQSNGPSSANAGLIASGQDSIVSHFSVQNSNYGVITEGQRGHLVDGIVSHNQNYGIRGDRYSLSHLTVANNVTDGIFSREGYKTLNNLLSVHNGTGLEINNDVGHQVKIYNVSSIDNRIREIFFSDNTSTAKWHEKVHLGRTVNRCVYGTSVMNVGMTGVDCESFDDSTFTRVLDINSNDILTGFTIDAVNPLGSFGLIGVFFESLTDWFSFESPFKKWTKLDLNPLPTSDIAGRCSAGDTCGIFDWRLKASSYNLERLNGEFVPDQACPEISKGSKALTYFSGVTEYLALQGVAEYILDGYGNDNGHCEANERCYFIAGNGAQLREPWNFTKTCIYDPDGSTLTGIAIYGE